MVTTIIEVSAQKKKITLFTWPSVKQLNSYATPYDDFKSNT